MAVMVEFLVADRVHNVDMEITEVSPVVEIVRSVSMELMMESLAVEKVHSAVMAEMEVFRVDG